MFYSLKSRLIAVFILLFVLSFGTLAVLLFNESRAIIRSYIESSALEKMEEYGSYINMVQTQVYDLASLIYNSDITEGWDAAVSDPGLPDGEKMLEHIKMSDLLTQTRNSYSNVSSVSIYRREGLWVSGDNQVVRDKTFLGQKWYNDFMTQGTHWIPAHVDQVELMLGNRHPVVSMLMPIGTFEPSLAKNVMKVNVHASYFVEPLDRIHLGRSGTIFLLDHEGKPILAQAEYGRHAEWAQAVEDVRGGWRRQGVVYMENERGTTDILVYKKLPRTNWMLTGFVSEEDLYAELFSLRNSIVVFVSLLLVLSVAIAIWLSHGISKPLSRLVMAMRHVQRGDFDYAEHRLPPDMPVRSEVGFATAAFRNMVGRLRQHIKNEFELKLLRQQAEYKALLMQINPHFLFNTLELMSSLAMQRRTEDTVQVIESLGKMMRFSLKMSDDLIMLEEELKYAGDYASILRVRFGDRLQLTITREGELHAVRIIKFILQPLIENAVIYTFSRRKDAVVDVAVRRAGGRIRLSVADNGPGLSDEVKRRLLGETAAARGRAAAKPREADRARQRAGKMQAVLRGTVRGSHGDERIRRRADRADYTDTGGDKPCTAY